MSAGKALLFVLTLLLACTFAGCRDNYQKEIDSIYVSNSVFGQTAPEYKIDLKNRQLWEYRADGGSGSMPRNESAKDEGFTFVRDLDTEKVATFIRESARAGFTRWEGSYVNEQVTDGHQWSIRIMFADGTEKDISGSNAYPSTWDNMYTAFEALTGENVLLLKSG